MIFKINNTSMWINEEQKNLYEKYGLTFEPTDAEFIKHGKWQRTMDDSTIEIKSLEQLMDIVKDVGDIVLSEKSIEIYDNYRE